MNFIYLLVFILFLRIVSAKCPASTKNALEFIIEHAVWRGWHQAIIFTTASDCNWTILHLVKCLGVNGIASAVNVNESARLETSLGIVIFTPTQYETNTTKRFKTTVDKIIKWKMNTASHDWLIMAESVKDIKIVSDALNATAGRFDQNILVALPNIPRKSKSLKFCDHNFIYNRKDTFNYYRPNINKVNKNYTKPCRYKQFSIYNCNKTEYEINYFQSSIRLKKITRNRSYKSFDKLIPLWQSGTLNYNFSRSFRVENISNFSLTTNLRKWKYIDFNRASAKYIHILQFFKMRFNSTLFVTHLGFWNEEHSMSSVHTPYPVEARNLMGEKFVFGRCTHNSTTDGPMALDDDGPAAPDLLDDVLHFLTLRLNATSKTRYYGKLGFRTYEGSWTGLLGALLDQSVDIALEPVTAISSHHKDMDFIFPIAKTMCDVYIRHQETSAVRDIFLAPFDRQLIACVVCGVLITSAILVFISRTKFHADSRRMNCIEAVIWSMGVLCQQGGSWTPPNPAASVLLIVYLFFALVTYNAYAAFITSVLSVRVSSVSSLADVLESTNIKIGYVRNGADQMYLMSTKDVQLNAFYIRGYSEAENLVSTTEEGLVRAAMQDYAFFSGQRIARSTLRSLSQARGRCALRELPVMSSRAQLSFPLLAGSPYGRSVLLSLLQLRSGGVLARLEAALVPGMPQCSPPSDFASARAADVKTALVVIFIGFVSALLIGIAEYSWKYRVECMRSLRARLRRLLN